LKQEEGQQATLHRDVLIFILIIIAQYNPMQLITQLVILIKTLLLKNVVSVQGSLAEVADFHQVGINSYSD